MAEAATKAEKPRAIYEDRFVSEQTKRNRWFATAETGTTVEDLMNPAYWAHIAYKVNPYDLITVAIDDETFYVELIVRSAAPNSVCVTLKSRVDFEDGDVPEVFQDAYQVKWRGPHGKWSVVRLSDKAVVKEFLASRPDANRWLMENAKVLGA